MKAKFWEVNYDERAFITLKEKKKIDDSMTLFPEGYYRKNMNIFNEKLKMACFCCNTTEYFIFSLKYRQRKVDLNTSKESLVFVTIQSFIFTTSYRIRKFDIYAKTCICRKMLVSYIFAWRKAQKIWYFRETETYEN